jgi:hypothetical protein
MLPMLFSLLVNIFVNCYPTIPSALFSFLRVHPQYNISKIPGLEHLGTCLVGFLYLQVSVVFGGLFSGSVSRKTADFP